MKANSEPVFPLDYRAARRAFIAAAEAAGLDSIGRVHPSRGPNGNPLCADSVAIGPRKAARALLVISGRHARTARLGSMVQTGLLREGFGAHIPKGGRVVLLHALNPFGFAWNKPDPQRRWGAGVLASVAAEDLAAATRLLVLDLGGATPPAKQKALAACLPKAKVTFKTMRNTAPGDMRQAQSAMMAAVMAQIAAL